MNAYKKRQTSQLPQDDRISISFKEYLAEIDVCMGGRVAEELSGSHSLERVRLDQDLTCSIPHTVYGPQNVTSGASSDLRHATNTANAMVKVTSSSIYDLFGAGLNEMFFYFKLWGYSGKVGPVYHNDREDNMSSRKREEIESEVRSYVARFPQSPAFCISLGYLRVMQDQMGRWILGPLIPFLIF